MFEAPLQTIVQSSTGELRFAPATPIDAVALDAAARKVGWPIPDDYRECLTTYGAANVFGAQLLAPSEWRARMEPHDQTDLLSPAPCYLPFARREIPTGGELLFCFRFELSIKDSHLDVRSFSHAGESRPTFFGLPYRVVACHLPNGLSGARLEASQRDFCDSFSTWVAQLETLVKARAAQR